MYSGKLQTGDFRRAIVTHVYPDDKGLVRTVTVKMYRRDSRRAPADYKPGSNVSMTVAVQRLSVLLPTETQYNADTGVYSITGCAGTCYTWSLLPEDYTESQLPGHNAAASQVLAIEQVTSDNAHAHSDFNAYRHMHKKVTPFYQEINSIYWRDHNIKWKS